MLVVNLGDGAVAGDPQDDLVTEPNQLLRVVFARGDQDRALGGEQRPFGDARRTAAGLN